VAHLPRLAKRAARELDRRLALVQDRRDIEEGALTEARRIVLAEQHERRLSGIEKRMSTVLERRRGPEIIRMIEGQRRRQRERYERLLADLETRKPDSVSLRYLAVCHVEVTQ